MADGSIVINTRVDQTGFAAGRGKLEAGIKGMTGSLKSMAAAAGLAFGAAALINFGKESVKAATALSNALTGLKSIVEGQGRSFQDAEGFLKSYISDGLVPAAEAATAYKNLALRGYDDSQIQSVMVAFKNSAAYGRQASLSMGQAISGATEGLKNENSILVDNAGVTKNVAKMWDDYAKSIGVSSTALTKEQKIQAEVNGILYETRFQMGDAAKMSGTYSGQIAKLEFQFNQFKVAVGDAIIPIITALLPAINALLESLTRAARAAADVSQALFGNAKGQQATAEATKDNAKAEQQLADATKKAGKEAKGALASFDELNILQTGSDTTDTAAQASVNAPTAAGSLAGGEIGKGTTVSGDVLKAVNVLEGIFSGLKDFITQAFSPSFEAWGTAFASLSEPVAGAVESIWASITTLWDEALAPFAGYLLEDFIPGIVNGFSETFAPIFADVMPVAISEFAKDFEFYSNQISRYVNDILKPAYEGIKTVALGVFDGIKKAWDEHGASLLEKFQTFKDGIREVWDSLWTKIIKPVFDSFMAIVTRLWNDHLKPLWDSLMDFFGSVGELVLSLWNNVLKPAIDWFIDNVWPKLKRVIDIIGQIIGTVIGIIVDNVRGIIKAVTAVVDFLVGVFTGDWQKAWNAIKDIFIGAWETAKNIFKGIINLIIDGLNLVWMGIYDFVKALVNSIGGIAGALGSLFGQNWYFAMPEKPPLIPHLATGAVIPPRAEFLAVLGDQKSGRNIETPEALMRQIVREELAGMQTAEAGGDVYVYVGNEQLDAYIERSAARRRLRTNGVEA